ncbi:C40 family peptidase [Candidatus Uhrbacteria bacterium]|nr:C40 family peptidase [Candidatus Uhrbacteria bacterium]
MKRHPFIFAVFLLSLMCLNLVFGSPVSAQSSTTLMKPLLQVDIPTVTFSDATIDGDVLSINYLGDYISGMYIYLLGISTTIAIVMLMVGGLQYAFGGVSEAQITKAKERIKNAVIGLVLLISTYAILAIVNPNLVSLPPLTIENVDYEPLLTDSGDNSGYINWAELEEKLIEIGITCAGSDESGDVALIAQSFSGKVTYRFGAKGGDPQYTGEQSRQVGGEYTASFCPEGTVCSDCSGFVDMIAQCAGLESIGESRGTNGIFASSERITQCDGNAISTDTESVELVEGDLVGYKPGDRPDQPDYGHVWMYIGNDKVISAMGGSTGRSSGNSVQIQNLSSICSKYPLRYAPR